MTDNSVLTDEVRADLKAKAEKAARAVPGRWQADSERNDGEYGSAPESRIGFNSYALFNEKGLRILDGSNSEVAEIHEDEDSAWDETGSVVFDFLEASDPAVILSLLAALEEAEGRIKAKDEALLSAALNLDACEVKIKHRARGGDLSHILVAGWADRARAAAAPSKREADKPEAPVNTYCPWCSEAIMPGQPTGTSDGELMHIGCAAEDMDNATFDRDMGGGR